MASMRVLHLCIQDFYLTIERTKQNVPPAAKMVIHFPEDPGFVVSESASAREAGVRSRMPLDHAKSILPDGLFFPADFQLYAQISEQLNTRLRERYPFTEQLDFYEWFSDVTGEDETEEIEPSLSQRLRHRYPFELKCNFSRNKFLAKLGNDISKKIQSEIVRDTLNTTPLENFWGIPKKWIVELKAMGIETIGEVGGLDPDLLEKKFPTAGLRLVRLGRGEDDHEVQPFSKPSRLSRSASCRITPEEPVPSKILTAMSEELSDQLIKSGYTGFALRLDVIGSGQKVSHRYRFLLPTVRPSSILVGASSMMKKMQDLLPKEGTVQVSLSVDDIVYNRDVYQMHGSPKSDLEVLND